jgi:hypothetical protein
MQQCKNALVHQALHQCDYLQTGERSQARNQPGELPDAARRKCLRELVDL